MSLSAEFWAQLTLNVVPMYFFIMQSFYCHRTQGLCDCKVARLRKINTILTVSIGCGLTAVLIDTVRIYLRETTSFSQDAQRVLQIFMTAFFGVGIFLLYSVLLLRQRALYSNKALLHLSNKFTRFVSNYGIFIVMTVGILLTIFVSFFPRLELCNEECTKILLIVTLIVIPAIIQISLLALLVYPITKHNTFNSRAGLRQLAVTKRISVITGVCLICHFATAILRVFVLTEIPRQLNLISNQVCVLLSTVDWKSRIFPCSATRPRTSNLPEPSSSHRQTITQNQNGNDEIREQKPGPLKDESIKMNNSLVTSPTP